jgi:hypothetical protein
VSPNKEDFEGGIRPSTIGTPAGLINIFHLGHTYCYF